MTPPPMTTTRARFGNTGSDMRRHDSLTLGAGKTRRSCAQTQNLRVFLRKNARGSAQTARHTDCVEARPNGRLRHRDGRLRRRRHRQRRRVADLGGGLRGLPRHDDQELRLADPRRRVLVSRAALDRPGAQPGRHARRGRRAQLGGLPQVRRRAAGLGRHRRHLRGEDRRRARARLPLVGVTPKEVFAVPIGEHGAARRRAPTRRRTPSCSASSPAGSASPREAILRGLAQEVREEGPRAGRRERARLRARRAVRARSTRSTTPRAMEPPDVDAAPRCSPTATTCAPRRRSSPGCEFFGGYPITPSTEMMQFFTREIWKYGGAVLQAEDEIAGIGAALGASFAGKKAMTATSGPGMSLKTEILGLASIAELPLVIVNVQRGGPSTGLPTKPEQSDLFQAAFSAARRRAAPRARADVASPTRFDVTVEAFNIAEQLPDAGHHPVATRRSRSARRPSIPSTPRASRSSTAASRPPPSSKDYERFRMTEDGISPISHPGMKGGNYQGAGIEHNEHGNPTASGKVHAAMNDKRFRKLAPLKRRKDLFHIEGDPERPARARRAGARSPACAARRCLRAGAEGLDGQAAGAVAALPGRRGVYRDFFAVGAGRPRRRASAPGAALPHPPHVRRRAPRASVRSAAAAPTPSSPDDVLAQAPRSRRRLSSSRPSAQQIASEE